MPMMVVSFMSALTHSTGMPYRRLHPVKWQALQYLSLLVDSLSTMPSGYVERHAWSVELLSIQANRPKRAQSGARAQTFGAALDKLEQLWRASETCRRNKPCWGRRMTRSAPT